MILHQVNVIDELGKFSCKYLNESKLRILKLSILNFIIFKFVTMREQELTFMRKNFTTVLIRKAVTS